MAKVLGPIKGGHCTEVRLSVVFTYVQGYNFAYNYCIYL